MITYNKIIDTKNEISKIQSIIINIYYKYRQIDWLKDNNEKAKINKFRFRLKFRNYSFLEKKNIYNFNEIHEMLN